MACLLVLAAGAGVVWKYHRTILTRYAMLFRVDDPTPSDAIVMLLGGPESRPYKAAALYREGYAPRIVLCAGQPAREGFARESHAAVRAMAVSGVPLSAITIIDKKTMSTFDEANAILPLAKERGWKSLIVVTTSFHTRRSRFAFSRIFRDSGIAIHIAAAADPDFDETNWFEHDESALVYFNETMKTLYYWLRY